MTNKRHDPEEESLNRDALDREAFALLASIDHLKLYARRIADDTGTDPFDAETYRRIADCAQSIEDTLFYDPQREER